MSSHKKISRKAKILPQFSIYSGNKPPLDLLEIQRKSFCDLLERGIIDELSKTDTFRETAKFSGFTQELELVFNPDTYKLVSPNCTPKEAILKGKTYACKLYVQATLTIRFSPRGSASSVREEGETEKKSLVVPRLSLAGTSGAKKMHVHNEKNSTHLVETTKNPKVARDPLPFKYSEKSLRYLQSLRPSQPTVSWTPGYRSLERLPIASNEIHGAKKSIRMVNDIKRQSENGAYIFDVTKKKVLPLYRINPCFDSKKIKRSTTTFVGSPIIKKVVAPSPRVQYFSNKIIDGEPDALGHLLRPFQECTTKSYQLDSQRKFERCCFWLHKVDTQTTINAHTFYNTLAHRAPLVLFTPGVQRSCKVQSTWKRVSASCKARVLQTKVHCASSIVNDNDLMSKVWSTSAAWFYTCFVKADLMHNLRSKEVKLREVKGGSFFAVHQITKSPISSAPTSYASVQSADRGCKISSRSWCETSLVRAFKFVSANNVNIIGQKQPFAPVPDAPQVVKRLCTSDAASLHRRCIALAVSIPFAPCSFAAPKVHGVHRALDELYISEGAKPDTKFTSLICRFPKATFAPPVHKQISDIMSHFAIAGGNQIWGEGVDSGISSTENTGALAVNSDESVTQRVKIFRPWIFLGELPLMTKRGHFILNGSPRVIVNQMARCPGIYFQEKRRGVGFEQEVRVSADLIPQRGPWLRIQSDWEGRFWARLKREGRVKYATLYEAFQEFEKQYNAPLVSLVTNNSSSFPKSEILAFQERKVKEDRQKKALVRFFKNSTRYSLGKQGRLRINQRVHSSQPESYSSARCTMPLGGKGAKVTVHLGCSKAAKCKEDGRRQDDFRLSKPTLDSTSYNISSIRHFQGTSKAEKIVQRSCKANETNMPLATLLPLQKRCTVNDGKNNASLLKNYNQLLFLPPPSTNQINSLLCTNTQNAHHRYNRLDWLYVQLIKKSSLLSIVDPRSPFSTSTLSLATHIPSVNVHNRKMLYSEAVKQVTMPLLPSSMVGKEGGSLHLCTPSKMEEGAPCIAHVTLAPQVSASPASSCEAKPLLETQVHRKRRKGSLGLRRYMANNSIDSVNKPSASLTSVVKGSGANKLITPIPLQLLYTMPLRGKGEFSTTDVHLLKTKEKNPDVVCLEQPLRFTMHDRQYWASARKDSKELHKFWSEFFSTRSPFQRLTNLLCIENVRQFISLKKSNSNAIFALNSNFNLLGKLTSILSSTKFISRNPICPLREPFAPSPTMGDGSRGIVMPLLPSSMVGKASRADEMHVEHVKRSYNDIKNSVDDTEHLLMAADVNAIHICLEHLLEGQGFTDDIDHLKNRLVRTSGKLLQQQLELGLDRLSEVMTPLLQNLIQGQLLFSKDTDKSSLHQGRLPLPRRGIVNDAENQPLKKNVRREKNNVTMPLLPSSMVGKDAASHAHLTLAPQVSASLASSCEAKPLLETQVPRKQPSNGPVDSVNKSDATLHSLKPIVSHAASQPLDESGKSKAQQVKKIGNQLYGSTELVKNHQEGTKVIPVKSLEKPNFTEKTAKRRLPKVNNEEDKKRRSASFPQDNSANAPSSISSAPAVHGVQRRSFACTTSDAASHALPLPTMGDGSRGIVQDTMPLLPSSMVGKGVSASSSSLQQTPFRWLRTSKPVNNAFREFFGSNPLSQYMDQTNPLAEITHKRRLSSMGPGGIKRETAGMEVRGIHPTHYGRVCPIETPEGKNAGLVNSPTVYGRIGKDGFMETPLYQVIESQVQKERWAFFSAQQEEIEESSLATGDTGVTRFNFLSHIPIPVQTANNPLAHFQQVERHRVGYKALSPVQTISIATALIPFLEHDDANRALMGSNMQRQAIPLLSPERPIVGTGFEPMVMSESGQAIQATKTGCVSHVSANKIILESIHSTWEAPPTVRSCKVTNEGQSKRRLGCTPLWGSEALPTVHLCSGGASCKEDGSRGITMHLHRRCMAPSSISFAPLVLFTPGVQRSCKVQYTMPLLPSSMVGKGVSASCIALPSTLRYSLYRRCILPRSEMLEKMHRVNLHISKKLGLRTATNLHLCSTQSAFLFKKVEQSLQLYQRSNQETCLSQRPLVCEGDWVQKGDFLADCSASHSGDLALGKNVTVAYMPWEGYNFEDAIVISDRLVANDIYTSIHIERYEIKVSKNSQGKERITNQIPSLSSQHLKHLGSHGIARVSSWVQPGDILVGKVVELKRPLSPYERLAWELASRLSPNSPEREKWLSKVWLEDISLRLPAGVCGRVINFQIISTEWSEKEHTLIPLEVHVYLAVKRKIQVGDKLAGRHGNKGIVSIVLPRQDMPYLGDGSSVDMVLNPLGVPSRMNLGQIFECLLGLAGSQLGCNFKVTPFDEIAGGEASRSLVFLKLYQCRLIYKQQWLFTPTFPGKNKLFDGRTGEPFENWVTVGQAYMLKLIHMVDHKIHARSTGPYSLFTRQPVRGRSRRGGQRLGEMEVWAVEGFGAAYTLQEFLTIKSDDLKARAALQRSFYKKNDVTLGKVHISPGNPEAFRVLVSELQALCLHIQM